MGLHKWITEKEKEEKEEEEEEECNRSTSLSYFNHPFLREKMNFMFSQCPGFFYDLGLTFLFDQEQME